METENSAIATEIKKNLYNRKTNKLNTAKIIIAQKENV